MIVGLKKGEFKCCDAEFWLVTQLNPADALSTSDSGSPPILIEKLEVRLLGIDDIEGAIKNALLSVMGVFGYWECYNYFA